METAMSAWVMSLKLDCPTCHKQIEGISAKVDFIIQDGERHKTGETWETSCGHFIHDWLVDWDTDEDSDGMVWSALLDAETGMPVLVWMDGKTEDRPACDCEDCEREDCDDRDAGSL